MFNFKNYKIKFDPFGLILFLIIMIPTFIWAAAPAPNDVLRAESVTPITDAVGSVFQVLMVASLLLLRNISADNSMNNALFAGTVTSVILYFIGWVLYYLGAVNPIIILDLCIAPCLAFIMFSIARKNGFSLIFAVLFMIFHTISSIINFIA